MWECGGFADLLPRAVAVEQSEGGVETIADVWPEEAPAIQGSVPRRRSEFAITRTCARRALQRLGIEAQAIPVGSDRRPVWPPGVVGSLTHAADLHAAAVARRTAVEGVGIDVEANVRLSAGVLPLVVAQSESRDLATLTSTWPHVAWDRLLFSAKETIFKAWCSANGRWLGFADCVVTIEPRTATFSGFLHPRLDLQPGVGHSVVEGRWGINEGRLLTAATLTAK